MEVLSAEPGTSQAQPQFEASWPCSLRARVLEFVVQRFGAQYYGALLTASKSDPEFGCAPFEQDSYPKPDKPPKTKHVPAITTGRIRGRE